MSQESSAPSVTNTNSTREHSLQLSTDDENIMLRCELRDARRLLAAVLKQLGGTIVITKETLVDLNFSKGRLVEHHRGDAGNVTLEYKEEEKEK